MVRRYATLAALFCCLLLSPSLLYAQATWSTGHEVPEVSGLGATQFSYVAADGTGLLATFRVKASAALVCFDADTGGAAAGTATVEPWYFPLGPATATLGTIDFGIGMGGANGNANLDGTEGDATTQNACMWVGPGFFGLFMATACGAGDACVVSVQGGGL